MAVEDIINQALRRIGYPTPIGFIFEGSRASRIAVEIYSQTRDNLLRAKDYPFARRDVALVLNGQTAPAPWLYEYTYPADCLRIRQVMPSPPGNYPILDPQAILFTDYNDQRLNPAAKAILTTISPAKLVYTGQVTDGATWDANFTESLVEGLGRRLAVALRGSGDMLTIQASLEEAATAAALDSQANRPPGPVVARSNIQTEQKRQ